MKTILVLGLTYNQIPLVQKAKEMGYRVFAIGVGGGGGGECACDAYADDCLPIDTSDKEAVLSFTKRENVVGLLTCGTSTAICTIAYVSQKLSLSNKVIPYKVACNATYKQRFRRIIRALLPCGIFSSHITEAYLNSRRLCYPLILKPADGGGGKGITGIHSPGENLFASAFNYALDYSLNKKIIIEEFIEGPVLGTESFVINGVIKLLAIADKIITSPPRCVTLGVTFPSILSQDIQRKICELNKEAIRCLDIRWGPVHIDMVVNRNGEPKIIDIGPRLAGGPIMSKLIPDAYSFDIYKETIKLAVGEMANLPEKCNSNYYGSRFILPLKKGILRGIDYSNFDTKKYNISSIRQLISNGCNLGNMDNDSARLMMFTSKAKTYNRLISNLNQFEKSIKIQMSHEK